MATATEQIHVRPAVSDQVFVRDSAVVALDADEHGDDALAAWQFSAQGRPTGAYVVRQDDAFSSPDTARHLLSFLERRAITASDVSGMASLLERLTAVAKLDAEQWWEGHLFSVTGAFAEIHPRRELYDRTVTAVREAGRNTTPLEWDQDFSGPAPDDFATLHELSGRRTPPGAPVVSEVLSVCGVLGWLIERWQETEQVKNRRGYVFDAHGAPEPLPPSWLAAAREAETNRLAL